MNTRPYSVMKNSKHISVNPMCLPELKLRPESLMLEEEFAQEVSRIFKFYDESMRFSNSFQPQEILSPQRINRSQARDSLSSSKRNSRNLQVNRLSKNIKRKQVKKALKQKFNKNNRSLVVLPLESEPAPKRKSSLENVRASFIQQGTYSNNTSDYYFSNSPESYESDISHLNTNSSYGSPASGGIFNSSASSPISAGLMSPTDCNVSIDISNMNIRNKNRVSKNVVKTTSNIYQIQQMPFIIQYNEANKYDSINIMIENTNDESIDEDSVILKINGSHESINPIESQSRDDDTKNEIDEQNKNLVSNSNINENENKNENTSENENENENVN
ncbi:hypothetical protein BCR32DRAFT_324977, partial [Anaeromyces robustus]